MRRMTEQHRWVLRMISLLLILSVTIAMAAAPAFGYARSSNDAEITGWTVSGSGDQLLFSFGGKMSNAYYGQKEASITYGDGSTAALQLIVNAANSTGTVNYNWNQIGEMSVQGDVSGEFQAECTIPVSTFKNKNFTINFCGSSVKTADLFGESGDSEKEETETPEQGEKPDTEKEPAQKDEASDETSNGDKLTPTVSGKIEVDGSLEDWTSIDGMKSSDSKIEEWKTAMDTAGNLYLCFTGTAVSQWDGDYQWKVLSLSQNGKTENVQVANANSKGWTCVTVNEANGNTAAPYYVEIKIPSSCLSDPNFTVALAGVEVPAASIPVVDGKEVPKGEAVYSGIVIDGKYSDWDAVKKTDADGKNGVGQNNLSSTAVVFDGDQVYIYLKECEGGSAAGAGSHGNGNYAITTDLGRTLLFQLTSDGTVRGVEGAKAQHVGSQWEISIPASELPYYLKSINFGLYLTEPYITGIENLNGQDSGGSFGGIVYDGQYGDWNYYPHTPIEYATAGTHEVVQDAEGALYSTGKTIYGHFETTMPAHLQEAGQELTEDITFRFNEEASKDFYPRPIAVDGNGNINWDPERIHLPDGTYEFYLASTDAWHTSTNISDLNEKDQIYGRMMVTIDHSGIDQCEFELYVDKVAEKLGLDESELKTISAQFGRLGQQWVTIAGTSSGPWLGIALCIAAAAAGMVLGRRHRQRIEVKQG